MHLKLKQRSKKNAWVAFHRLIAVCFYWLYAYQISKLQCWHFLFAENQLPASRHYKIQVLIKSIAEFLCCLVCIHIPQMQSQGSMAPIQLYEQATALYQRILQKEKKKAAVK